MSLLNSRRTALAPVFNLPDDILLDIFLLVRDSSELWSQNWYQIAHICGYWRRVAVASPSLWKRLHNPPHALIPLMLQRSQTAPLDVHLSILDPKRSTKTLTTIFHEIERIKTLTFSPREPDFLDTVHGALASLGRDWEAALLDSLTITIGGNLRSASVKVAMDVFRPTRLLRKLYLTGGYYDWSIPPLPNLTHLYLYTRSLGEVSGAHFLQTLHQMQNLQDLGIDWKKVNLRQFPPTPRPRPIHLPSLQRLNILNGYPVQVEPFLPLVTHPKLHQLSVGISSPVTNIAALTQSVLSSIGKGNFSPLESLRISFDNDMGITISAQPSSSSYYGGSFIHMSIPIDEEMFNFTDHDFLVGIMSCITPFDCPDKMPLRHLNLEGWDLTIDEFTRLFAFLPHLETIEADEKLASILFKVLNITSASYSSPIPFPKLWSIARIGDRLRIREEVPVLSPSVFDDLYSALLSRHAHGTTITKLRLVVCECLDATQARQLEEIGVELTVEI